MSAYKLLIDGNLEDGDSVMDIINPATEEVICGCPRASARQLDKAVAAALSAFPAWAKKPVSERKAALTTIADIIEGNASDLARLLTQEQGKPLSEATSEVFGTAGFFRYFASLDIQSNTIDGGPNRRIEIRRNPLGVVAAIIPWNFPLLIFAFKVPPGVLNVITDANDLGGAMTAHPDIRKISFTGSTATGKKVMAGAAETLKRVTLELGGNDAGIVLDDVDPKVMAPKIFAGAFANSGQVCVAIKRLYVHESIYDEMCAELGKLADAVVVGDGLEQGTQLGPMQNKMQYDKVNKLIREAADYGTVMNHGGAKPDKGFFIRPVIVRDIADGNRLVDEEQFGPVLPVLKYSDTDDALARANSSMHGLGGSIWSSDIDRATKLAARMESGTVWINQHIDVNPAVPFGGAKQSGLGVEMGEEGLAEFSQLQVINVAV